jgi:Ca2+-dependent lipid-binding protein
MDPYVEIKGATITHRTTVKQGAGKNPRWNEVRFINNHQLISSLFMFQLEEKQT